MTEAAAPVAQSRALPMEGFFRYALQTVAGSVAHHLHRSRSTGAQHPRISPATYRPSQPAQCPSGPGHRVRVAHAFAAPVAGT